MCGEEEGDAYGRELSGSLPFILEQPSMLVLCEAMAAAAEAVHQGLPGQGDIQMWLEARFQVRGCSLKDMRHFGS
jgi:hypothetical protein